MTSYNFLAIASLAILYCAQSANAFSLTIPSNLMQARGATRLHMQPTNNGPGRRRGGYSPYGGSFFGSSPFFPTIEEIMSLYPDMLGVSIPECTPTGVGARGRRGRGGYYTNAYGAPCAPKQQQQQQGQQDSSGVRYKSPGRDRGYPRYEIVEEEDAFKLIMDVPGVKEEDIDIAIEGEERRFLHVRGVRKVEEIRGLTTERRFERSFVLDKNLDETRISAKMENGVLTVTAPKKDPAPKNKTVKISIDTKTTSSDDDSSTAVTTTSAQKKEIDISNKEEENDEEDGATIDLDINESDMKAKSSDENDSSSSAENKEKKEDDGE